MREIRSGSIFRHFKGNHVKIINIAKHTENNEKLVIYEELATGRIWARPYNIFISEVDHNKYPDIKQKYRFEKRISATTGQVVDKDKNARDSDIEASLLVSLGADKILQELHGGIYEES